MKKVIINLFCVVLFNGCVLVEEITNDSSINITIKSNENILLNSDSQIKFQLYGYDHNWADVPATLLQTYVENINEIPTTYSLEYDNDWENDIEYNTGESSTFGYYITIRVDVDNNGVIDNNDYVMDYDLTPFTRQYRMKDLSGDLYIKAYSLSVETAF